MVRHRRRAAGIINSEFIALPFSGCRPTGDKSFLTKTMRRNHDGERAAKAGCSPCRSSSLAATITARRPMQQAGRRRSRRMPVEIRVAVATPSRAPFGFGPRVQEAALVAG
jgi:hypothetical protein